MKAIVGTELCMHAHVGFLPIYAKGVFRPARSGAVLLFVALPPVSWLLIAMAVSIAARIFGISGRLLPLAPPKRAPSTPFREERITTVDQKSD